jgi:uncharacterized membrane protein
VQNGSEISRNNGISPMKKESAPGNKTTKDTRSVSRRGLGDPEDEKVDLLLNILLVLVAVVAITTTVFVIVSPKEHAQFSDFFILGENRTADAYPDLILAGPDYPMFIGVGNHEGQNMTYRIETWVSKTVFDTGTNTTSILMMEPGKSLSLTLGHNETRIIPYNLSVNKTGYNRVEFLLFNETLPAPGVTNGDRINASYRNLNLWIDVR